MNFEFGHVPVTFVSGDEQGGYDKVVEPAQELGQCPHNVSRALPWVTGKSSYAAICWQPSPQLSCHHDL